MRTDAVKSPLQQPPEGVELLPAIDSIRKGTRVMDILLADVLASRLHQRHGVLLLLFGGTPPQGRAAQRLLLRSVSRTQLQQAAPSLS